MLFRNHFLFNKCIIYIPAIILCLANCKKKNDYDILKEKIDTTKVHLYIGLKALIGQTHTDPDLKKARNELIKLLNSSSQKSELSARDMYRLTKHLEKSLDIIEGMGIITDETRLVRSYLDCSKGKESAPKGLKTIKLVLASTTEGKDTREDAQYIQEYCEAAAVSDSKIKKKISYYNLVLKMMIHAINRTNVSGDFVNSSEFKLLKKISSIVDTLAKIQSPDELKKFVKPTGKKLKIRVQKSGYTLFYTDSHAFYKFLTQGFKEMIYLKH